MEHTFKPFNELTYSDDYMFRKVMENKEICKKVIERLLHIEVSDIVYPELEKTIRPFYTTKGVRLDVYVKDTNRIFDIEMQSYSEEALGNRMRYYQSMIDIDSLMKGDDYTKLKESFIIFICKNSPFKSSNRSIYTFKNTCLEDNKININDKSLKLIYNASAYEDENDSKIKAFLEYVSIQNPVDELTSEISRKIADIKRIEKNKTEYMSMNLHDSDIYRKAKAEGERNYALETALRLISMNMPINQISEATKLSVEEIQKLSEKK